MFICLAFQMTDIYLPLLVGATVFFAQPDAINVSIYKLVVACVLDLTHLCKIYLSTMFLTIASQGSLGETLREVKPTFFFGVPRYPLFFTVCVHAQRCLIKQSVLSVCQFILTVSSPCSFTTME